MYDLKTIDKKLKKILSPNRYQHSLRVAEAAKEIAGKNSYDRQKAYLAGLLHDCARDLSGEELLLEAQKNDLPINDFFRNNPITLHAPISACWARNIFNINDEEVLSAIEKHTMGDKEMSLLDKIIFVADFIEPSRSFPQAAEFRAIIENNLQQGVEGKFKAMLQYTSNNKRGIKKDSE